MPKLSGRQKVRRYGQIYPSRRSTSALVLRSVLTITLLLGLGFVGWNAYGPVSDYFSGKLAVMSHQSSKKASEAIPEESQTESAPEEPQPQQEKQLQVSKDIKGVYLPPAMLGDEAQLQATIAELVEAGFNAVVFDLKDASGIVHYQSSLETVLRIQAQSEDAVDLARICKLLNENDMIPIGRVNLFADPYAASRIEDVGIKYMNTEMLWLDNSPENGGKGWLNPYSTKTRDYLTSIVSEITSIGVQRVLIDQCSFPVGVGLEFANYGASADLSNQGAVLKETLEAVRQAAEKNGAQISLYVSGEAALGKSNRFYGNINPLTLSDDITLGLMPAQFGDGYAVDDFSLEEPVGQPYETVKSLLTYLRASLEDKKVTGMVQGYTATGALENNKVYTAEDIAAQYKAMQEMSIKDYIIYSPNGNYPVKQG